MKSKVYKLDVDKLLPFLVDISKLSDVVKRDVVTKDVYNAKIKNIEDKIPDITNLATKTALNAVENKVPNVIFNLVKKKLTITQTLMKLKRKFLIIFMINILLFQNLIS